MTQILQGGNILVLVKYFLTMDKCVKSGYIFSSTAIVNVKRKT